MADKRDWRAEQCEFDVPEFRKWEVRNAKNGTLLLNQIDESTARLIAAAPDMAEALQSLLKETKDALEFAIEQAGGAPRVGDNFEDQPIVKKTYAALKKAGVIK